MLRTNLNRAFFVLCGVLVLAVSTTQPAQAKPHSLKYYLKQRDKCIERTVTKQGYALDEVYEKSVYNTAEWSCTKKMAKKNAKKYPGKVIALGIRTDFVSDYTREDGIGGDVKQKELNAMHALRLFTGVTIDDDGRISISDKQMKKWRAASYRFFVEPYL